MSTAKEAKDSQEQFSQAPQRVFDFPFAGTEKLQFYKQEFTRQQQEQMQKEMQD